MFERRHVVRDFDDVIERRAWRSLQFEQQKIGQRGLRPLDLGGEHGFFSNVGVEEQMRSGQQRGYAVQTAQRQ